MRPKICPLVTPFRNKISGSSKFLFQPRNFKQLCIFRQKVLSYRVVLPDPKIRDIDLPDFKGTPEERLRAACVWVADNSPGRQLTLEEIGKIMGVTRERVRQIEAHALRKLRHPSRIRFLQES